MTLALGMTGDDVRQLQTQLAAAGLLGGEPDGQFDDATQAAVVEAQRRVGLPQTGVVEDSTWRALGVDTTAADPASTLAEPTPPSRGSLLAVGLLFGGIYWFAHRHEAKGWGGEEEEEEDESEEEGESYSDADEDDDEDEGGFVPPEDRAAAVGDYEDAVTDSLLDEPAVVSASGTAGDCKKAAHLLLKRQGLIQRPSEHQLFDRTMRKVASNCRKQRLALKDAIRDEQARRDELDEEIWRKVVKKDDEPQPRAETREPGMRKHKLKWTKKSTSDERDTDRKRGRQTVRGSHTVRPKGGKAYKVRAEKAKTKRGYTWRREND